MSRGTPGRDSWKGERILVLSPTPSHPQDFGNRKRIFQVCNRITADGGRISFAHYPAEADWRTASPWSAERAMAAAWDQYFTIPPTRHLHTAPHGEYHQIDEWWDDSIGHFLRWAFRAHSFDAFIVNYAWLSKAFEYTPDHVIKILDTHDKVSGRRELLLANGLAPEFFFTTPEEEARALDRADLVWAIKPEEQEAFEKMSRTPVMTLPHLDPLLPIKRPEPDADGYLRVGFLGARNSVNRASLLAFLEIALPLFERWFAPIKFIVAGSVCDELESIDSPFVELRGRVSDVAQLYGSVDCIAVPMTFSTGLKIKTGEALSFAMPLIATAHAFEGYESGHPLHALPDLKALALALVELSFAPRSALDELATASVRTHQETASRIERTFAETRAFLRDRQKTIVLAVDSRAIAEVGIFRAVLQSSHEYLRFLGNLIVLVVKGSAADLVNAGPALGELSRLVVADDLPDIDLHRGALAAHGVECVNVEAFLQEKNAKVLFLDAAHPAFETAASGEMAIFSRPDLISLSEAREDFPLPAICWGRAFVVSHFISRETSHWKTMGASHIRAPLLYRTPQLRPLRPASAPHIVVLGSPQTEAVALALAMAEAWRIDVRLVPPIGEPADMPVLFQGNGTCATPLHFLTGLVDGTGSRPLFALDLSAGRVGLQLCREMLERLNVPVVATSPTCPQPTSRPGFLPPAIATEADLARIFSAFMHDATAAQRWRRDHNAVSAYEKDAGWAYIWAVCKRVEQGDSIFA
ncbi:MAG TPA: glycosyltransferase [Rhizomicrobium sp.]|jgi:hypothetical protein